MTSNISKINNMFIRMFLYICAGACPGGKDKIIHNNEIINDFIM